LFEQNVVIDGLFNSMVTSFKTCFVSSEKKTSLKTAKNRRKSTKIDFELRFRVTRKYRGLLV